MPGNPYPKIYVYRRIVRAKLFIDLACCRKINLEQIANEACFSKFHFIRLFKRIYGMTPHQYCMMRRIEAAKALLRSGRYSVIQACYEVGFESVTSFVALFKRQVGRTPRVFLAEQRLRRVEMSRNPLKFVPHCFASASHYK